MGFFLRLLLRCIVIICQALTIKLKSGWWMCVLLRLTREVAALHDIHLFFWAFWADLVILPEVDVFFSTPLMTPTATVWRMSRTAKRPRRKKPFNNVIFQKIRFKKKRSSGRESDYREEGTQRSSPHTWACPGSCPQWQHHQTWAI